MEVFQKAVSSINLKIALEKGLAFWQIRSSAFILRNSVPADGIEKVVNTRTEKILYQNTHPSSRPPLKVILKDAWQV